uniref:TFIIE domain-containing protein n=1 Tax=Rhabditophanes sp. KR3021 TaxID=114890 RepID=A0AC35TUC8_9BILA
MVVYEIPQVLKRLTLIIGKLFYDPQSFLALQFMVSRTIIQEEELRKAMRTDSKNLKVFLQHLKDDKVIKEKFTTGEENNRAKKIYFYFINYRTLLNVTKYKLDHIRQKLEGKEKNDANKAMYKCTRCLTDFETMDIAKLINNATGSLICYICLAEVEIMDFEEKKDDNSSAKSMAHFNSQMSEIFEMILGLENITFDPSLLDPPIPDLIKEEVEEVDKQKVVSVGAKFFSKEDKTRTAMYENGIHVTFAGKDSINQVAKKVAVPWLQNNTIEADYDRFGNNDALMLNETSEASEVSAVKNEKLDTKEYLRKVLGEDEAPVEVRKMTHATEKLLGDEPSLQLEYDKIHEKRKQALDNFQYMSDTEEENDEPIVEGFKIKLEYDIETKRIRKEVNFIINVENDSRFINSLNVAQIKYLRARHPEAYSQFRNLKRKYHQEYIFLKSEK